MKDGLAERSLMERVRRGDRAAFALIVERHQGAVYGFLRARVVQPSDAEDLVQEVFLRCYQVRKQFDKSQLVRPWLLGIARNVLREYVRRNKRRKEVGWTELCLEMDDLAADDHAQFDEALAHLPACLQALGPSARQAIDMRYAANLRLSEIGRRLHRSEGAIKLLMFRARAALRHCLAGKHEPTES